MLKKLLIHPLAREMDVNDPQTTVLRRRILKEKQFLRRIYQEWYEGLIRALPAEEGPVLELGTGAGFLKEWLPDVIASDLLPLPGLSLVLDAHEVPFQDGTLRAIVMIDVLHHLPRPRRFLQEAARCVRPGGVVAMIEPWVSTWSRLVYTKLHHEPFQPEASQWEFPVAGPLSGANGALPWIMFHRDRSRLAAEFPEWRVKSIEPDMPFSYLLSGGVSMRALAPGAAYGPIRRIERLMKPWMEACALFARIVLERLDHGTRN